jgi:hypothetical protein
MTAHVHAAASLLRVGIVKRPYSLIYRSHDLDLMIIIEMDYRSGIAVAVGRSHITHRSRIHENCASIVQIVKPTKPRHLSCSHAWAKHATGRGRDASRDDRGRHRRALGRPPDRLEGRHRLTSRSRWLTAILACSDTRRSRAFPVGTLPEHGTARCRTVLSVAATIFAGPSLPAFLDQQPHDRQ